MWLSFEALFRMLRAETIRLVLPLGATVMNSTTQGISPLRQRMIEEMQMRQLEIGRAHV